MSSPRSAPLRLLLATHYFPQHRGGVERIAGQLAARLAATGQFDIEWHASDCDPPPADVAGLRHVPARSCNLVERALGFPYPVWSPAALARLARAARDADVVHLHDCLYLPNLVASLAARRAGRPVLVTQHVGFVPYRNPLLRALLWLANHALGRLVLGGATRVVFESDSVQRYFSRFVRFRQAPLRVENGVDTGVFFPAGKAPAARPQLLFVGRFVEKKGLPLLRELARRLPQAQWLLAGWGPLDPGDWRLPNVSVVRSPRPEELIPLYRAVDLFVLPSVGEGMPLAVQEAMACGTPALVGEETAAGCPDAGADLLLREPVDGVERWEARIRRLLEGQELAALRPRVAAFAREHWSWDSCTARYAGILRECAAA